jgi:hypothetical protein
LLRDCTWILGSLGGAFSHASVSVAAALVPALWHSDRAHGLCRAAWNAWPILFTHVEGIAAYCDHLVRFGVVESINEPIARTRAPLTHFGHLIDFESCTSGLAAIDDSLR